MVDTVEFVLILKSVMILRKANGKIREAEFCLVKTKDLFLKEGAWYFKRLLGRFFMQQMMVSAQDKPRLLCVSCSGIS